MFKSKHKSKNPIGFVADTAFDFFLPKPKKSHKKRNGLIIAGASALMLGVAGLINQKPDQS
jgi:hypothetical protein